MDDAKLNVDIVNQGSVLVQSHLSTNIDEQIYKVAFNTCLHSDIAHIIWICYQHIPEDLIKTLKKNGMNYEAISHKVVFIDMISAMLGEINKKDNVIYCSMPTDYKGIFRTVEGVIDRVGRCIIIIDNLNAMMSYDVPENIIQKIRTLNGIVSKNDCTALFLKISGSNNTQEETAIMASMHKVYNLKYSLHKRTLHEIINLNPFFLALLLIMLFINMTMSVLIMFQVF